MPAPRAAAIAVLLFAIAACQPPTSDTEGLAPPTDTPVAPPPPAPPPPPPPPPPSTPLPPVLGDLPPAVFPNAPATAEGWTLASACAQTALPALNPSANGCGQTYFSGQIPTMTLVGSGDSAVSRIGFHNLASGPDYGGGAPSQFTLTGNLPANTGHLYVGQYVRWSSNWWHPANAGHKTFFLLEADGTTAHFFAWVDNTSVQAGALLAKFGTQWTRNAGNPYVDEAWTDTDASHALSKGQWHLVEYRITPNAPGARDGRLQVWTDGVLVMNATNVPLFRPGATQRWAGIWYSPIYAGSGIMPRENQWLDLSHLRVMVR